MSRARSMSPGRPLRQPNKPYHPSHHPSQQLQQQHLAQLQQLQQLNQRFGSSSSSFSSGTQVSSANSTHSSSRHSVYGTHNYASSDGSFQNTRSVSQPTLSEPGTPTTVPDRYRRKSMVNLPSHERTPSLPSNSAGSSSATPPPPTQPSHVTGGQTYSQQAHSTNTSSASPHPPAANHSPPPRLSYSSTDSSAPSTTAASTSTQSTVHSFHKKTHSDETRPMVLPSDARRKSLLAKDPLGTLQDQRASAISLSSYHTVQSNSSPTRSMISDDSRESSPEVRHEKQTEQPADPVTKELPPTPQLAPPSNTTSYEDAVAAGVAAMANGDHEDTAIVADDRATVTTDADTTATVATASATASAPAQEHITAPVTEPAPESNSAPPSAPAHYSNYDKVAYNSPSYEAPAPTYDAPSALDPASERGRYRAKHSPPLSSPTKEAGTGTGSSQKSPQYLTQQQHVQQQQQKIPSPPVSQPSHGQSQRTMSLGGQSAFRDFDQPLYTTKSNMSIGGKSVGGISTSGFSTSGMSTQSSFSGLRHQKSSGSLRDKFKKVFSFGRKSSSSLSNAPTGSGHINLNPGAAQRSERTSTMTSTTSGRSFSEFLRRSSKPSNDFDDNRSIESNKSSSSFAALKRAGKNLLKKGDKGGNAGMAGSTPSNVPSRVGTPSNVPSRVGTPSNIPSRAGTPTPKLAPGSGSGTGFTPGMSPPKNTATASLSVSPAEVDRESAQWSAGSSLEGVLGQAASSGHGVSGNAVVAEPTIKAVEPTAEPEPAFEDARGDVFADAVEGTPTGVAPEAAAPLPPSITTALASGLPSDSSSPTSVSSVNGGSAGSETDADEFVAAETVFPKHLGVEDIDNIRTSLDRTKSLERRGSRRRKVTPDSHAPEEQVPNPTEIHVHHPKSSLGRSDSTSTPRSILKSKQSDGSMVSVDTVTQGDRSRDTVREASFDRSRVSDVSSRDVSGDPTRDILPPRDSLTGTSAPAPIDIEIAQSSALADPEATPTGLESFMTSNGTNGSAGPSSEVGNDVESMFANFSSISSDLDLSFSTQLEPLGLPVRPESPTPSQQSSVRSTDSASVSRFATKLKDNLFKRKESTSSAGGFNPDLHETISEDSTDQDNLSSLGGHLAGGHMSDHVPLEGHQSFETASITSTEAPSLTESFRSEGSYSAPVPPQIPGGQRGNAPLRHFSPGPTPSNPNSHNRRFSGGVKTPQTAASRRYHQHGRSASYNDDGSRASGSPTTANYPAVHAPSPVSHARKGNVSFSSRIVIYDTWDSDDYDRRTEPATCNRLTPLLAQQIKEELNNFKMNMDVHHESRIYTHFF